MKAVHIIVAAMVLGACFVTPARSVAQPENTTRFTVGGRFELAEPKEEFRENVGNGVGAGAALLYHLDRPGWISLGFDASWLQYGHETKRVPFSQTVGGRILVDVNTTNSIAGFSFGPEFAVPRGFVRPYVNAAISGLLFRTASSVEGIRTNEDIAATTNASDWTRAWVFGGGVRIPVTGRDSRFALDFGVRYHRGGQASYLREGSIQDNPDGSITITPLVSRTPFMVYAIGFRYRIPYNSASPCPGWLC